MASLVISVMENVSDPFIDLEQSVLSIAEEDYPVFQGDLDEITYMLSCLIEMDDGYFRHDHDTIHARGKMHPVNHIDIFHADRISVKVGVANAMPLKVIRQMVSKNEDSFFLNV